MNLKHLGWIVAATALILLIPLVVMQFTNEVEWNLTDFIIVGALLIGAGLIFEFVRPRVAGKYRWLVAAVVVAAVLLVWTELAVGVLGTPIAGS
jgi:peptidoglycan/LPS O-acetylase OafA/YrhL